MNINNLFLLWLYHSAADPIQVLELLRQVAIKTKDPAATIHAWKKQETDFFAWVTSNARQDPRYEAYASNNPGIFKEVSKKIKEEVEPHIEDGFHLASFFLSIQKILEVDNGL